MSGPSNNTALSKDGNSEAKAIRYTLAPRILEESNPSYRSVEELEAAMSKPECKNIALTGVFGSGKSSVIDTYLSKDDAPKNVLRISLSNFVDEDNTDENDDTYESKIETKIFQHIIFKANAQNTQKSKYKRLTAIDDEKVIRFTKSLVALFICYIIVFEPSSLQIDAFYKFYHWALGKYSDVVNIISDIAASIIMLWILYQYLLCIIRRLSSFSVHSIKAGDYQVEITDDKEDFKKVTGEILYYLESGLYDAVIFEDLDRIRNSKHLFLKLREINILLNESYYMKEKGKITRFIYAIKDDIFPDEVRTKCFDYIIPVVPVVNSFNAGEYLIEHYGNILNDISTKDIKILGSYISRMRDLINIMNEYQLYKATILKKPMSETKLLALTIFKNLYPKDYSGVHENKGLLSNLFSSKKLFSNLLTKDKNEALTWCNNEINSDKEAICSLRRKVLDYLHQNHNVKKLIIKGNQFLLDDIARSDKLYYYFENDIVEYSVLDTDNRDIVEYNFHFADLIKKSYDVDKDSDYTKDVRYYEQMISRVQASKSRLEKEISNIEHKSLQDLISIINNSSNTIEIMCQIANNKPSHNDPEIKMLHSFIRNGYISEDFSSYVSYTYTGSLDQQDIKFEHSILQGITLPYDYKINHPAGIVEVLCSNNYENNYILNFSLLNYLINKGDLAIIDSFIKTARKYPDFIMEYDKTDDKKDSFFKSLFTGWQGCIEQISSIANNDLRTFMLHLFFRWAPIDFSPSADEIEFINSQYTFICDDIQNCNIQRLNDFVNHYDLKFKKLVTPTNQAKDFYELTVEGHHFDINYNNLRIIYGEPFETMTLTTMRAGNEQLLSYSLRDSDKLFDLIPDTDTKEDEPTLVWLSTQSGMTEEKLSNIIAKQENKVTKLEEVNKQFQQLYVETDHIVPSWANVREYNKNNPDFGPIAKFINNHAEELSAEMLSDNDEELQDTLFNNNDTLSIDAYKILSKSINIPISTEQIEQLAEERIEILLDSGFIEYCKESTLYFSEHSPYLLSKYIVRYFAKIQSSKETVEFKNSNELGMYVLSSGLTVDQKRFFLQEYGTVMDTDDSRTYSKDICQFYHDNGILGVDDPDLIVDAVVNYRGEGTWKTKMDIINTFHSVFPYEESRSTRMVNSLGEPYTDLNIFSHKTILDNNPENNALLNYLRANARFISNIKPDGDKVKVTYKKEKKE